MAINIDSLISRLDSLYGGAYSSLNKALGTNVNDYSSAMQNSSTVKAIARGGSDLYGVVADAASLQVVPYLVATSSVIVNAGSVYFNGVSKAVGTVVVALDFTDKNENSLTNGASITTALYGAYISCRDGSPAPTIAVTKELIYGYTNTASTNTIPLPDAPRGDVLLAKVYVMKGTGIASGFGCTDIRPNYEIAPSDDQITTLFSGFDNVENTFAAKSFKADFSNGLTALNAYTVAQTGMSLKAYTPTFLYTDGFKQLFADNYNEDLYTPLMLVGATQGNGGTYINYNKKLYKTNLIDAITVTPTITSTQQIKIWGVTPTNSYLTTFVNTTDTILYLQNTNGFDTSGDAAIYNYDGSFDFISYTGKTASSLTTVTNLDSTHRSGDSIYGVSNLSVYIPVSSSANNAYAVGTSTSKFYSVIQASYITNAYYSSLIQIRNH